jgi:hypothetical protein
VLDEPGAVGRRGEHVLEDSVPAVGTGRPGTDAIGERVRVRAPSPHATIRSGEEPLSRSVAVATTESLTTSKDSPGAVTGDINGDVVTGAPTVSAPWVRAPMPRPPGRARPLRSPATAGAARLDARNTWTLPQINWFPSTAYVTAAGTVPHSPRRSHRVR